MSNKLMALAVASVIAGGAFALTASAPAQAMPLSAPATAPVQAPAGMQGVDGLLNQVQYRHRGYRGHRGWGGPRYHRGGHYRGGWRHRGHSNAGAAIAAGIAGALALGVIANQSRVSRSESAWYQCEATYRSFRWSDGTFQPYGGGPRRICPYLL